MIRWWGRLFCRLIGTVLIIPALVMLFTVLRVPPGIPARVLLLVAVAGLCMLALGGMMFWIAPRRLPRDPNAPPPGHH